MEINKTKKLQSTQYYATTEEKKQIFWHHTAGTTADGAISWWNQTPERVGTAYVIDRDGTIFELFNPSAWAYHLGVYAKDGGDIHDLDEKQSIGIEIVSAGILHQDEKGNFVQYPLYPNKAGAHIIPHDEVWDMGENKEWRGSRFYQGYSDKQVESLIWLTKKLSEDYKISLPTDISKIFGFNAEVIKDKTPGLWSHSTVRKDKSDAIPYLPFIERVNTAFKFKTGEVIKHEDVVKAENKSSKPK